MSRWTRMCALGALAGAMLPAATYDSAVLVSLTFPDPVPEVLARSGPDGTLIADFFFPVILTGNAGFDPFAGVTSFSSSSGVLELGISGPSGFANPFGVSAAEGALSSPVVTLANLTSDALPVSLLLTYSYSLSATANDNETASAGVAIDVFSRLAGSSGTPTTVFHFDRSIHPDNAEEVDVTATLSLTLAAGSMTEFLLSAETNGQASSVPEPGTALGVAFGVGVMLYRTRRPSGN